MAYSGLPACLRDGRQPAQALGHDQVGSLLTERAPPLTRLMPEPEALVVAGESSSHVTHHAGAVSQGVERLGDPNLIA